MEKLIRDGKVAVLYSPGFGAGWFTWNRDKPEIVFDPELVTAVEAGDMAALEAIVERKYPDIYSGGMEQLTIEWIPEGDQFYIHEYDGSETIKTRESDEWMTA